ncbi:unnamed protein product [Cyclocybe aegerita]|uniref:CCHC-type domain-containing protein n=1 Tax=Cyclocybe aegerita TaxID=1973307 RepID=A0A8S0W138_CYCAE|nr:unnamed protein product [Cyclocybe aegerita]
MANSTTSIQVRRYFCERTRIFRVTSSSSCLGRLPRCYLPANPHGASDKRRRYGRRPNLKSRPFLCSFLTPHHLPCSPISGSVLERRCFEGRRSGSETVFICTEEVEKKMSGRGCFNCGGFGHQAASCPKAGTPTCYNCGAEGHVSRDCSAPTKAKACYKCGQEGHISRDCPDSATGGGGFTSSGGSGTECYKCGKVGHIARSCPEASSGGYNSFSGGGGGGSQKSCYTCGGVGHLSRDCVQGSKCYNCSGVGHISRDCPQPQKRACYTCGSEGHISRDCPGPAADGTA